MKESHPAWCNALRSILLRLPLSQTTLTCIIDFYSKETTFANAEAHRLIAFADAYAKQFGFA